MTRRCALLIGNQTFSPESGLSQLQGPTNDVVALARLLRDPERGGFEVHEFLDKSCREVLPHIDQALSDAAAGDFFLIYYSGHGKLDRNGRLCLATSDTSQRALVATSIPTRLLRELVEQSDCGQILLLLDCCYSGAVDDSRGGNVSDELHIVEDVRGFYIMTASTEIQVARETARGSDGLVMGRFTAALVECIESGAADLEHKGKILLSDLRRYLDHEITGQTPRFFARKASGDPIISLSPATAVPLLDAGVLGDLNAEPWHRRHGAVSALIAVLLEGSLLARKAARVALERRLQEERDYIIRAELTAALGLTAAETPPEQRSAERRLGAKFLRERNANRPLRREGGEYKFRLYVAAAHPNTSQVIFFTDDKSFIGKAHEMEYDLSLLVRGAPDTNGNFWAHKRDSYIWGCDGDHRLYAVGVTSNGESFSVSGSLTDAFRLHYGANPKELLPDVEAAMRIIASK